MSVPAPLPYSDMIELARLTGDNKIVDGMQIHVVRLIHRMRVVVAEWDLSVAQAALDEARDELTVAGDQVERLVMELKAARLGMSEVMSETPT